MLILSETMLFPPGFVTFTVQFPSGSFGTINLSTILTPVSLSVSTSNSATTSSFVSELIVIFN